MMLNTLLSATIAYQIISFDLESNYFAEWYCKHYAGQLITYQHQSHHILVHDPNPQPIMHNVEDFRMIDNKVCYTKTSKPQVRHCISCQKTMIN